MDEEEKQMREDVKKLRYFTKIDDKTWYVQRDKTSCMESFFVTLIPGGLVMHGDYDGLIVMPYTNNNMQTINWMKNATTRSYFAEKAKLGNQHHETKEYTEKKAMDELATTMIHRFDLDWDIKPVLIEAFSSYSFDENELLNKLSELEKYHPDSYPQERFDKICRAIRQVNHGSLENIHTFWEICQDLEHECGFMDLWELDPTEYTSQLCWQHICLMWWAKNVIDKQDIEYFEVDECLVKA